MFLFILLQKNHVPSFFLEVFEDHFFQERGGRLENTELYNDKGK